MHTLTAVQAKDMLINVAYAVINAKELLCQVDRDIGDGDHGIGMAGGFEEALKELQAKEYNDVYEVFFTVGRTLIRVMGGASGIIFGLLFYAGSRGMSPKAEINVEEFSDLFRKALVEIQGKGQAKPGDKTVIDALVPMVESLKESAAAKLSFKETLAKAYVAADVGVNSPDDETIYPLIAEKVVKIINSNYENKEYCFAELELGWRLRQISSPAFMLRFAMMLMPPNVPGSVITLMYSVWEQELSVRNWRKKF